MLQLFHSLKLTVWEHFHDLHTSRVLGFHISNSKEMGKKGSWFSALKKAFTSRSKDNHIKGPDKRVSRERKSCVLGKPNHHGDINSIIPLHRRPSSIEKILADADGEQNNRAHTVSGNKIQQPPSARAIKIKAQSSLLGKAPIPPNYAPSSAIKIQPPGPSKKKVLVHQNYAQISAIKIQAAYRGYRARRSYRALKALMRLQKRVRGESVKRQTANAMRCMQTLVRVQTQIRANRLQMVERTSSGAGTQQRQAPCKSENDCDGAFGKWNAVAARRHKGASEGHWDDSLLTKEEAESRLRRKVEAVMKRERALAYAYSHQLLKVTPSSAQAMLTDLRTAGSYPWWWTWLERQLPAEQRQNDTVPAAAHVGHQARTRSNHYDRHPDLATPCSSITMPPRQKPPHGSPRGRQHHHHRRTTSLKPDADGGLRDDASLTSCPPFSEQPNYMVPTASAKAKFRAQHSKGPGARQEDKKKRRFSFGLGQSIGSLFLSKETSAGQGSQRMVGVVGGGGRRHRPTDSIGGSSVDSAMSMPVGWIGKRHFYVPD